MSATTKKREQIMREIFVSHLKSYKDIKDPQLRIKCYKEFTERTGLSDYGAKEYYNVVLNDYRPLIPSAEIILQSLAEAEEHKTKITAIIEDLAKDIEAFKTGDFGKDKSNWLGEKESAFGAKSVLREQALKAYKTLTEINGTMGDFALKMYKANTDKDKNDIADERNKIAAKQGEVASFEQLSNQFAALQNLQNAISEKYQIAPSPTVINTNYRVIEEIKHESDSE